MRRHIEVTRLLRPALVTAAGGLLVVLTPSQWSPRPAAGGVRPASIASGSRVNAPTVSPVGAAQLGPTAIGPSVVVGSPTLASGSPPAATAPARIESTVAVGSPSVTRASAGSMTLTTISSTSTVGAPALQPPNANPIAPGTLGPSALVFNPTIAAAPTPAGALTFTNLEPLRFANGSYLELSA